MNEVTIVAHNGRFHADDVFAVATIKLFLERSDFPAWRNSKVTIIRTRDLEKIEKADFVVDVGGRHDEKNNRFDHHQEGGAGIRPNGIPYASFGLVWKKFGQPITDNQLVADRIDRFLAQPIDAHDNGFELSRSTLPDVLPYTIQRVVMAFSQTWKESPAILDTQFATLVAFAKDILEREIKHAIDFFEAESAVLDIYNRTEDKRILVFDTHYPVEEILHRVSEPLYIIRPDVQNQTWKINAMPIHSRTFELKKSFPASWAGKQDDELAKITGVPDALFCHNKLFLAVARSQAGALQLAKLALEA